MRLARPFYKLPIRFDVERLQADVRALPPGAWAPHPNEIKGNSSLRLISVDGGENDEVSGRMAPTPHLMGSPYLQQVLSSFGVVWSRSRLLKLAARHGVPQHADINYHWFYRARLHIPIVTNPQVRFHCGDESVHMAPGEAWIFDNWRLHRVENPVDAERIHLVADTSGSAAFWQLVGQGEVPNAPLHVHRFDASRSRPVLTENTSLAAVMHPAEIDLLVMDLQAELSAPPDAQPDSNRLAQFHHLLESFRRDWRQLHALWGDSPEGRPEFVKLRDSVRAVAPELGRELFMRTNRIAAPMVLEARVLRAALTPVRRRILERPVFIVAAPRSGSTLLFETLAAGSQVCTLGGEAHWLVESLASLRVGAPGVESNRLTEAHGSDAVGDDIRHQILTRAVDVDGRAVDPERALRFVEKTPKNALRIPFFNRLFPDARFIFLWRDPRENLSSIIEAWQSGRWKTYNGLEGFDGPWSLLLPPGWRRMNGRPPQEIAAFQWDSANRIILDDLAALPAARWTSLSYEQLLSDTPTAIRRLCNFADIGFDEGISQRVASTLPLSRHTHTPPAPDKWRRNEAAIAQVLPELKATWDRLLSL